MKLRAPLLLCGWLVCMSAHAGLFSDEESRKQIKQLEERIAKLEETNKQLTQNMLDLQMQTEALSGDLRKLQGQNEELQHSLQDAEKRQKDFYVDLDSRLRRFETGGEAQPGQPAIGGATAAPADPVAEGRDYDAAYGLFKANKQQASIVAFQDFLKKYPGSTQAPNAYFWMGVAYYALKDYKNAVNSYLTAANKYPDSPRAPNALLGAAICYQDINDNAAAKKTLQQLIKNYPDSEMVPRAKKRLAQLK
jgi:tol-pal system protein YbgF